MAYCGKCGFKIRDDSNYCVECGAAQSTSPIKPGEGLSRRKPLVHWLLAVLIIATLLNLIIFIHNILQPSTTSNKTLVNYKNRTPEEAVINFFKATDLQDFELLISALDHKGKYDKLEEICRVENIDYDELKKIFMAEVSKIDIELDKKYGNGWHKNMIVEKAIYSDTTNEVDVEVGMQGNGQGESIKVNIFKVPERGWYINEEKEDIYEFMEESISYLKGTHSKSEENNEEKPDSATENAGNNKDGWQNYSNVKYNFSMSIPDKSHCNVTEIDDSLIVELNDFNASIEISAFPIEDTLCTSRQEYLEVRTSAGGEAEVEGKINISGAEEAYLISEVTEEGGGKSIIAFKDNNVFVVAYTIDGEEQGNQEVVNGVEKIFNHMINSVKIK